MIKHVEEHHMSNSGGAGERQYSNITRGGFSRGRSLTKLIAAILAGTMLVPLSACGGSDSDTSALSSDSASESATPSESASPSETS